MSGETTDVTEYVAGFAFDVLGRVALIRKNRPAWQAGRLNGVGGHVEPAETPDNAMQREFEEETGVRLDGWHRFAVMDFPGARIHFYRLLDVPTTLMNRVTSTTDEDVYVGPPVTDPNRVIPNLTWLLPLAAYTADTYEPVYVQAAVAECLYPDTERTAEPEPECDNYRPPMTCLTAPSSETGRCDRCTANAEQRTAER